MAATRCRSASKAVLGAAYLAIGQPERWVEWCRAQLARGRDTHTLTRACLVVALAIAGSGDEAMAAANGLIDAAEATRNPFALSFALLAYGFAFRDADPVARAGRPAPGPGDRSRQRQPLQRVTPGGQSVRPRGRTRRPAGRARLLRSGDPQSTTTRATPPCIRSPAGRARRLLRPARTLRTGGHHRRFRVQSPRPQRPSPNSAPRSPTSAMSSATRPTNRSPARVRR